MVPPTRALVATERARTRRGLAVARMPTALKLTNEQATATTTKELRKARGDA
jgi:hypothetical protein